MRKKILALALALTLALGLSTSILGIYRIYMSAQLRRKVKALINSVRTLAAENARLRTPRARVYKLSYRARTFYTLYLRKMLTVLGPQAQHIPEGGNIRDNTAELLKVCGDIRDSIAELVQRYWVLFSYYCPCIQLCVEDYCHPGVYMTALYSAL